MLEELVDSFLANEAICRPCADEEPEADSLDEAIRIAALSIDRRGKRYGHQRRIPRIVLNRLSDALQARAEDIRQIESFAPLHALVLHECSAIRGAGELLAYDVAFRIGLFCGYEPEEVYLHAGAREGARKLGLAGNTLAKSKLPAALKAMRPCQVEDFLCVYKGRF